MANKPTPPPYIYDKQWLKSREDTFNTYLPQLQKLAKEQGEELPDTEALHQQCQQFLSTVPVDSDILVFASGSLLWNPLLRFSGQYRATLKGFHRRFCLKLTLLRGSVEKPGLMMALDEGGQCEGIAYRIPSAWIKEEMQWLWLRECSRDSYQAVWVTPEIEASPGLPCLAFIANTNSPYYLSSLSIQETCRAIKQASGTLGSNIDYFKNTLHHLRAMNVYDQELEAIERELQIK